MKKVFFAIVLTLNLNYLSAQNFSIGGEIGMASSINTNYELSDIENRRNTYYSGINVNYQINRNLSLTSGLHYLRQGYRHTTCYIFEEGVKNELTGKVDHLMIPLLLNIQYGRSGRFMTSVGLYGTYNIKAVQDYPNSIGGCMIYYIEDISPYTKETGLGGTIGLGYKIYDSEKFQFIPMLKYYQGMSNTSTISFDRKYSSALISLSVNYKI